MNGKRKNKDAVEDCMFHNHLIEPIILARFKGLENRQLFCKSLHEKKITLCVDQGII